MKKTKIVKDVDNELWQMFAGYAKAKGKKVGQLINEVIKDYLKNKIK